MKSDSGVCHFCKSKNIARYVNPSFVKDAQICFYCYTIKNKSHENKTHNIYSKFLLDSLSAFCNPIIENNNYKNIFLVHKSQNEPYSNFNEINNLKIIDDYKNNNLNSFLQEGKFDLVIVPDGNGFDINDLLNHFHIYLHDKSSIIISFYRDKYYTDSNFDYNFIYNCYSIDRIAKKYGLYVQDNFFYDNSLYIISLNKNEPSDFEIKNIEDLTNKHIIEDYQQAYIGNLL